MSYLSETFGIPLSKQFKAPDLQVTPESLMAPQQPFGSQPFGNLNAIGVSTPNTPPYLGAVQPPANPWADQSSFAPPESKYAQPTAVGNVQPMLSNMGIGNAPSISPTGEIYDTVDPTAADLIPRPAKLLDMPVRDQKAESKRLASMAGAGGLLGLLLGGGAGAIQGASSAVQGGSQALDFAAQNQAQKVQQENQKRLQEAANERQSWIDNLSVEDRAIQRKREAETDDFNRTLKTLDFELRSAKSDNDVLKRLDKSKNDTIQYASNQVTTDETGNFVLAPSAQYAVEQYNQVAVTAGHPELVIDPRSIGPSQKTVSSIMKSKVDEARIGGMIQNQDFLAQVMPLRVMLESNKISLQEAEAQYKALRNQYYPDLMKATVAEKKAIANDLPTYLGLRRDVMSATVAEKQARTQKTLNGPSNEKVNPVLLSDIQDVRKSMQPENWTKTEAAIRKKYDIPKFNYDPASEPGKKQAADRAAMEKEIKSTRDGIVEKAKALGFTDVTFENGQFKYKNVPNPLPNKSPDYLASDKPEGFGSYNPAWTGNDLSEYRKLAKGESNIIKEVPSDTVRNLKPLGWRTTLYGYEGDNTKGDPNSPKGVGTENKVLTPGSIAVSKDVLDSLKSRGYAMGDRVPVYFQKQGKTYKGSFLLRDATSKDLTGRVDIFMPAGTKATMDKYDGAAVIAVGRKEVKKLQTEEVPNKKGVAKPAGRKVESKAPSASEDRKRLDAINRELNKKPKNMFEGYGG